MNIPVSVAGSSALRSTTVEATVKDIVATAALPLERAITIPREAYVDEEFFRVEARTVLEAGWLCIAHVSQLKETGSFLARELLGEPLLVVRDKTGVIRVLSRACAHRAMDIMPEGFHYPREGKASVLLCPYHHWTYNLDGSLRGCAEMGRAECFDRKDWRLGEFRSEIWKGFIFVNLDGKAPPLSEQYADFAKAVAAWAAEDMEIVISMSWECEFNWKVMIENWMESYHHLGAHRDTLHPSMPGENTWTEPEHPYFIRSHLPFTEELAGRVRAAGEGRGKLPGFYTLPGTSMADRTEWGLYIGYPCFMFLTMSDRVLWYRLEPISANSCKLETMTLVHRDNLKDPDFVETVESEKEALREFHVQDMLVNTAVQRGLKSRKVVRGRLSHLEEPVWLIYRYLSARLRRTYPARAERAPYYGPLARSA
jgi:phenylpropionate dioxygenase-like ring-hydroxylating dioxygenase large terminal subunit